ncbi:hypothetical protein J6590_000180 [Homalodisca vitripennis]|nr:hypothetical protein J6590_000180 [Homalodisca vitripennis]
MPLVKAIMRMLPTSTTQLRPCTGIPSLVEDLEFSGDESRSEKGFSKRTRLKGITIYGDLSSLLQNFISASGLFSHFILKPLRGSVEFRSVPLLAAGANTLVTLACQTLRNPSQFMAHPLREELQLNNVFACTFTPLLRIPRLFRNVGSSVATMPLVKLPTQVHIKSKKGHRIKHIRQMAHWYTDLPLTGMHNSDFCYLALVMNIGVNWTVLYLHVSSNLHASVNIRDLYSRGKSATIGTEALKSVQDVDPSKVTLTQEAGHQPLAGLAFIHALGRFLARLQRPSAPLPSPSFAYAFDCQMTSATVVNGWLRTCYIIAGNLQYPNSNSFCNPSSADDDCMLKRL